MMGAMRDSEGERSSSRSALLARAVPPIRPFLPTSSSPKPPPLLLPSTTTSTTSWYHESITPISTAVLGFLPDFTEHPKPKRQKTVVVQPKAPPSTTADGNNDEDEEEGEVTFLQDCVAGGMAGSASVIVGHPLDTLKVRVQNSTQASSSVMAAMTEFGGFSSLFRGMGAPLSAAALVNAIVFSSYGLGSRLYDSYLVDPSSSSSSSSSTSSDESQGSGSSHDPWQKAMTCGAFAGLVQCVVICPMEHVKCRLQIQHGKGSADNLYKGPFQAASRIVKKHGVQRLFQGWCSTVSREVPAFGMYFAVYDYMKDHVNALLARQQRQAHRNRLDGTTTAFQALVPSGFQHTHTWIASACAGGIAGSVTWGVVYPVDVSTYDD
jgi:Mitochondrial carrier protein